MDETAKKSSIKLFTLLIDGKDHDTGIYEYFPYADKSISDFKNTYRTIMHLKKNDNVENADEYVYAKYCVGKSETNMAAMAAAQKASKEFKYFPVSKRLKIMYAIHKNLVRNKDEFIKLLIIEGHTARMAQWEYNSMELGYRKETLDMFKGELWKEAGRFRHETIYLVRKADGVVAVSPPKNAPASNSLTAGYALLGGNTIVIKPPLRMPISTIFLWKEIVNKALVANSAPPGTVNIVLGNSKQITQEWLSSDQINDIYYFGDSAIGLELGKKCYDMGKKPILELSGNDVLFVWNKCDLDSAVESAIEAFIGSTQICMVPKNILVHEEIYDEFIAKYIAMAKSLKFGLPSDPDTYLTPVIKIDDFFKFLDDAQINGANLLCGGKRVNYRGEEDVQGSYLQPTIVGMDYDESIYNMFCIKDENFFPLVPVIRVRADKDHRLRDESIFNKMIAFTNRNEYGLRMSVWVNSFYYTRKFMKYLTNCGILRLNSSHVALSQHLSSHGGTGKSGGPFGEMNYVWQKTTHLQGISLARERRKIKR